MIKKEQGDKREFSTGAKRQNATGKPRPGLFPGDAYLAISQHFADGAAVYDDRNWEQGLPLNSIIDSLERHIAQEKMGMTDESHDLALAWNAVVYLATKLRIKAGLLPAELDDMPKYEKIEQSVDRCPADWEVTFAPGTPCDYDVKGNCSHKCRGVKND